MSSSERPSRRSTRLARLVLPATSIATLVLAGVVTGPASSASAAATQVVFSTVGASTWTVPTGICQATFDVAGGQGGSGGTFSGTGGAGGLGGEVVANVAVTAGASVQINVGQAGGAGGGTTSVGAGGSGGGASGGTGCRRSRRGWWRGL